MDGFRFVDPVKTRQATAVSSNKSNPRAKFAEPLTPLHRLARFKEIRDRNLARQTNPRRSIQPKRLPTARSSLAMDSVVNGVAKSEPKIAKMKKVEGLSNGSEKLAHPNATNGNGLSDGPVDQAETASGDELVESIKKSPKRNGTGDPTKNAVDPEATIIEDAAEPVVEDEEIKEEIVVEAENDTDSEVGQESEGSSLDVVGESSSESLDLHVSSRASQENSGNEAGTSEIQDTSIAPEEEPSRPVTPEIVRKIRAGGRIAVRRAVRGEYSSPALKRKMDDTDDCSSGKKLRDDGSTKSPGWQFFSPTKSFAKFWSPARSPPKSIVEVDESMIVNVDEQSNIFDKIHDETATTLIEDSQETRSTRWCTVM